MRKGKYDGKRVRAIWGTADGEEYFKQLILRSITQLISFENQNIGSGW